MRYLTDLLHPLHPELLLLDLLLLLSLQAYCGCRLLLLQPPALTCYARCLRLLLLHTAPHYVHLTSPAVLGDLTVQ
jgi:hypothetical protein